MIRKEEQWVNDLSPERLREARHVVGALPTWMVHSLYAAEIPVIPVEMLNERGEPAFMMPPALVGALQAGPMNGPTGRAE